MDIYQRRQCTLNAMGAVNAASYLQNLDIDRKEEEDEEGEEISDNIRYNEILDALSREEFNRRMSEEERGEFECLEDEARENYRRLHPEEED